MLSRLIGLSLPKTNRFGIDDAVEYYQRRLKNMEEFNRVWRTGKRSNRPYIDMILCLETVSDMIDTSMLLHKNYCFCMIKSVYEYDNPHSNNRLQKKRAVKT